MTSAPPLSVPDQALFDGLSKFCALTALRMDGLCSQYPEPELADIRNSIIQALNDGADPNREDHYHHQGGFEVEPITVALWGCDAKMVQTILEKSQPKSCGRTVGSSLAPNCMTQTSTSGQTRKISKNTGKNI